MLKRPPQSFPFGVIGHLAPPEVGDLGFGASPSKSFLHQDVSGDGIESVVMAKDAAARYRVRSITIIIRQVENSSPHSTPRRAPAIGYGMNAREFENRLDMRHKALGHW